jgi:hypothetical protein
VISNRLIACAQNKEINNKQSFITMKIVRDFLLTLHGAVKRINVFVSFQSWVFVSAGAYASPNAHIHSNQYLQSSHLKLLLTKAP